MKAALLIFATLLATARGTTIYDYEANTIDGNGVSLSQYRGKVVVILNVATNWGLANTNYNQLQTLYTQYKDQGLRVAAFPCNQFGGQEPGTNAEIKARVLAKYGITFDLFAKINVNGDDAHPLWKFLKEKQPGPMSWVTGGKIPWNFTKFLIDRQGNPVDRFLPTTSPDSMEDEILAELNKPAGDTPQTLNV